MRSPFPARSTLAAKLSALREPRILILLGLLAALAAPKLALSAMATMPGGDGGYYTNVAQHVRDGDGLVTDLSLHHHGFPHLPHPTGIYPLWPLIYGYAAKVVGLYTAGVWLPTLFYFVALLVAYALGRALLDTELFPDTFPGFDAGHVLMLLLGLNREFIWFSSLPYTEALAYMLLLATLLRGFTHWRRPTLWGGLELGLWAGLALLARSQMFLLILSIAATALVAVACTPRKVRYATMGLASFASFAAVLTPHYLHLRSFVPERHLQAILRFDLARGSSVLPPLEPMVKTDGPLSWLADRGQGVLHAFSISDPYSYTHHFYALPYVALAAVVLIAFRARSLLRTERLRQLHAWLRDPNHMPTVFVLIFAAGGLLSIHALHKQVWAEWNFQIRHSLTCLPLFFLALLYLLRGGSRLARTAGTAILCATLFAGTIEVPELFRRAERDQREMFRPSLVRWLNIEHARRGELIVASQWIQRAWLETPGVGYHSFFDSTTLTDVKNMVRHLGVDYLLVPRINQAAFLSDPDFERYFSLIGIRSSCRIYRPDADLLGTQTTSES